MKKICLLAVLLMVLFSGTAFAQILMTNIGYTFGSETADMWYEDNLTQEIGNFKHDYDSSLYYLKMISISESTYMTMDASGAFYSLWEIANQNTNFQNNVDASFVGFEYGWLFLPVGFGRLGAGFILGWNTFRTTNWKPIALFPVGVSVAFTTTLFDRIAVLATAQYAKEFTNNSGFEDDDSTVLTLGGSVSLMPFADSGFLALTVEPRYQVRRHTDSEHKETSVFTRTTMNVGVSVFGW